jgi:hypothetical protein
MLILCLTAILQLVAGQYSLTTKLISVPGQPDSCQFREQHAAVDVAIQNIRHTHDEILSALSRQCGSGLWSRVAYLNMSDPLQQCPPSWRLYSANGVRACGRQVITSTTGGCNSHTYTVQQNYQRVCGQIIGYQIGSTDVFGDLLLSINEPYVDGVSVTYGVPRRHIWTFAAGLSETIVTGGDHEKYTCPCALNGTAFRMQQPPAFVGNNYFCESGNPLTSFQNTNDFQYTDDPLWDGQRCEGLCCTDSNSPPWFSVMLPGATSDGIEVRICSRQETDNEDTPIGLLEIYVQ